MKTASTAVSLAFFAALASLTPAHAQGVVKGAQDGAAVGNRAAGPVGGAVGGVAGGVVGGVKGVLGVPQNTSTSTARTRRASAGGDLSQSSMKSDLLGRPLQWANADGTQTATVVFYTDGTAAMMGSN